MRSGVSARGQRAISTVVRRQPSHSRCSTSSRHTPMQGEGMIPAQVKGGGAPDKEAIGDA